MKLLIKDVGRNPSGKTLIKVTNTDNDNILFCRIQYPKLCSDISVNSEKGESKEWLKERCKHNKFFSKNENLCANLDTIEKEDYEKNNSNSADDFELTTTPFTTPTSTDIQEEVEVTTETESLTT